MAFENILKSLTSIANGVNSAKSSMTNLFSAMQKTAAANKNNTTATNNNTLSTKTAYKEYAPEDYFDAAGLKEENDPANTPSITGGGGGNNTQRKWGDKSEQAIQDLVEDYKKQGLTAEQIAGKIKSLEKTAYGSDGVITKDGLKYEALKRLQAQMGTDNNKSTPPSTTKTTNNSSSGGPGYTPSNEEITNGLHLENYDDDKLQQFIDNITKSLKSATGNTKLLYESFLQRANEEKAKRRREVTLEPDKPDTTNTNLGNDTTVPDDTQNKRNVNNSLAQAEKARKEAEAERRRAEQLYIEQQKKKAEEAQKAHEEQVKQQAEQEASKPKEVAAMEPDKPDTTNTNLGNDTTPKETEVVAPREINFTQDAEIGDRWTRTAVDEQPKTTPLYDNMYLIGNGNYNNVDDNGNITNANTNRWALDYNKLFPQIQQS